MKYYHNSAIVDSNPLPGSFFYQREQDNCTDYYFTLSSNKSLGIVNWEVPS